MRATVFQRKGHVKLLIFISCHIILDESITPDVNTQRRKSHVRIQQINKAVYNTMLNRNRAQSTAGPMSVFRNELHTKHHHHVKCPLISDVDCHRFMGHTVGATDTFTDGRKGIRLQRSQSEPGVAGW